VTNRLYKVKMIPNISLMKVQQKILIIFAFGFEIQLLQSTKLYPCCIKIGLHRDHKRPKIYFSMKRSDYCVKIIDHLLWISNYTINIWEILLMCTSNIGAVG